MCSGILHFFQSNCLVNTTNSEFHDFLKAYTVRLLINEYDEMKINLNRFFEHKLHKLLYFAEAWEFFLHIDLKP